MIAPEETASNNASRASGKSTNPLTHLVTAAGMKQETAKWQVSAPSNTSLHGRIVSSAAPTMMGVGNPAPSPALMSAALNPAAPISGLQLPHMGLPPQMAAALGGLTPEMARTLAVAQFRPHQRQAPHVAPGAAAAAAGLTHNDLLALARVVPGLVSIPGLGGSSTLDLLQGLQQLTQLQNQNQQPQQQQPSMTVPQAPKAHIPPPMNGIESTSKVKSSHVSNSKMASSAEDRTKDMAVQSNGATNPPGTIILPCRARGMPVDHNFRTAHFVIPGNVRHGEDLICSYMACRNAGIKFRYCASCRVPVAKRNFHQRHNHGLQVAEETNKKNSTIAAVKAPARTPTPALVLALAPTVSSTKTSKASAPEPPTNNVETHTHSSESKGADAAAVSSENPDSDIPMSRQLRWATLLPRRPDSTDADSMSAWLLEVMAVSDLKTALKKNAGTQSPTIAGGSYNDCSSDTRQPTSSVTSSDMSSDSSIEEYVRTKKKARHARKKRQLEETERRKKNNHEVELEKTPKKPPKKKHKRNPGGEKKDEKKKRSPDEKDEKKKKLKKLEYAGAPPEDAELSGSYAEWRDRKKQKAMSKKIEVASGQQD